VSAAATAAAASGRLRIDLATCPAEIDGAVPRTREVIEQRFARQAQCIVARRDGEFAGFIWWCPQQYVEDEVRCVYRWRPTALAAWDYDVYVAPEFRMGRLFTRLWEGAHRRLHEQGVRWTLSRIDAFNAASLAAHRRLGARELGQALFVVAGPWQLARFSVPPRWHFSTRADDCPGLEFDLAPLLRTDAG
jgi:L-amino acid N-acyltransferase YncA